MVRFVFAFACLAAAYSPGSGSTTEETEPATTQAPGESRPKATVYSDVIRISDRTDPKKYDTISYSEPQTRSSESKIIVVDNGRAYEVGQQPFQSPSPFLSSAIGAVSAHLIHRAREEYVPYPPNGNPQNYPPYHGWEVGREARGPLDGAYARANAAGYGYHPSHNPGTHPEFQNYRYYQRDCYHDYYPGEFSERSFDVDETSFAPRRSSEPIKRQAFTSSFG